MLKNIKKYFKQCKHEWTFEGARQDNETYQEAAQRVHVMSCSKCGKVKSIKV